MAGSFELYRVCRAAGLKPFPGIEAYLVLDLDEPAKDAKRYHITLMAYTTKGYQALVKLASLSHRRDHFYRKPRIALSDLASMAAEGRTNGIACLTGCYFGLVQQAMVTDGVEGLNNATRLTEMLAGWFPGSTYVEVQHHHTDHGSGTSAASWTDDLLAVELHKVAQHLSLPLMVTQDCHYTDKAHGPLHTTMKALAYGADPSDVGFPGDSYHLASEPWVKSHFVGAAELERVWEAGLEGSADLLSKHTLTIPPLDKYSYYVPRAHDSEGTSLAGLCWEAMADRGLTGRQYIDALRYELGVIEQGGMESYFLLVLDYVAWCKSEGIQVMARGSATGSLVCYLLGFSQADPIYWDLTFDRFLTPDRERPPDIDLDIEDRRRGDLIEWLSKRYKLVGIGTYGRMGLDEETGRGSVFVKYLASKRRTLGDQFAATLGRVDTLEDLAMVYPEDAAKLAAMAKLPIRSAPGAHAAGFVLSQPELEVTDWIPTMLIASSDTTVTQMTMDDVEDAGLVKIDILGLRSLSTIAMTLELIGKQGLEWIPLDDRKTMTMLRRGRAGTGVFQLEGWTASKGCKEMKVRTVADLILVNALYRPATIDHGYTAAYLKGKLDPSIVTYPGPVFKRHLKATHGVPVFQEQVLAILRDLGMPPAELNGFLKAVKGKHAKGGYSETSDRIFAAAHGTFDDLCSAAAMTPEQISEAWSLVEGFAAYGFNKAHATAYGLLGYQIAYLKVHYPLEFHAALLATTAGTPKEKGYVDEARRCKQRILRADVNLSGVSWTMDADKQAIRRGLTSIKGVGAKAAVPIAEAAPFTSMADLIERCPARAVTGGKSWRKDQTLNGVLGKLQQAGALRSLGVTPL